MPVASSSRLRARPGPDQQTAPGIDKIGGGERVTIGPLELGTQEETPDQPVLAGLPALGLGRYDPPCPSSLTSPSNKSTSTTSPGKPERIWAGSRDSGFGAIALDQGLAIRQRRLLDTVVACSGGASSRPSSRREPATGWPGSGAQNHDINLVQNTYFKKGKAGGAPEYECMMPRLLSPKTPRIVSGLPKRWSLSGHFSVVFMRCERLSPASFIWLHFQEFLWGTSGWHWQQPVYGR